MKDCPSYPILHLPDYGIDLNFPLTRIRIGNKADCHIALARREKNDFWASINSVGEKWRLVIKGRIWLNERLYSDESGDLLLKNGDMLRIGALRLQFLTDLSEESESVDREVLQIPDVDDSFEVATESLRIVKPSVVFTIASAKRFTIHISTIAFIILTSYWLATGKALVVRSYLSQKFPASQKDNTKPIARKSISSLIKKPFEKKRRCPNKAPLHTIFSMLSLAGFFAAISRCVLFINLVKKAFCYGLSKQN